MMAKLSKVCNLGNKFSINFNVVTWTCYGVNASLFRSYVAFLRRRKMSILIDDWTQVPKYVKESIWTNVKVLILIYMIR